MENILGTVNTRAVAYLVIAFILLVYYIVTRKKEAGFKIPVALFIWFLVLKVASLLLEGMLSESAATGLEITATVFLALATIRIFVFIVFDTVLRKKTGRPMPAITRDIGLAILYILAVLAVLRYEANVDLAGIITTSAILTAVIGLALQDTLGNLFAGIVLQMEKPYQIGDWVRFDTYVGKVVGMSWKSTRILTREKELISIPNNLVTKGHILNYSEPDPVHGAVFHVGTSYKDAPNDVRREIISALEGQDAVLKEPKPEVRVNAFGDFAIDYKVIFFTADFAHEESIKARILDQLWYRFARAGITIPFPVRTIKHEVGRPEEKKAKMDEEIKQAFAALKKVEIFASLGDDDIAKISSRALREGYAEGEFIVREGAMGDSMFVVVSGECDVVVGELKNVVATFGEGQFFGEMSLLTGEPRSASVIARADTCCVKIEKDDIKDIISANAAVATSMSEILAKRKAGLTALKDSAENGKAAGGGMAAQIFAKIKMFFNL